MTNQSINNPANKFLVISTTRSFVRARVSTNVFFNRAFPVSFSLAILIGILVIPYPIRGQEQWKDVGSFRMKMTCHIPKGDEGKPQTETIRYAFDAKDNAYISDNVSETIHIDGYFYSRPYGEEWAVMSLKTVEAMRLSDPSSNEEIKERRELGTKLFDDKNMQLLGIVILQGRKTKVYGNIQPYPTIINDIKVLAHAKKWVSVADSRIRKKEVIYSELNTGQMVATCNFYFYAYNTKIRISAPKLPIRLGDPHANTLIFEVERCDFKSNNTCKRNEFVLKWDTQHIKNAVGVILTREDTAKHQIITLGKIKQVKGSINDIICERSVYRIEAFDSKGRRIRKTAKERIMTRGSLEECH